MYTITMIVFDVKLGKTVSTAMPFSEEKQARAWFRELKQDESFDSLRLSDGDNNTLARWTYGEEDAAHEAFMTAANTAEAEKLWGMDAHKLPVIKDRRE